MEKYSVIGGEYLSKAYSSIGIRKDSKVRVTVYYLPLGKSNTLKILQIISFGREFVINHDTISPN